LSGALRCALVVVATALATATSAQVVTMRDAGLALQQQQLAPEKRDADWRAIAAGATPPQAAARPASK
jgi:hypothetical protein